MFLVRDVGVSGRGRMTHPDIAGYAVADREQIMGTDGGYVSKDGEDVGFWGALFTAAGSAYSSRQRRKLAQKEREFTYRERMAALERGAPFIPTTNSPYGRHPAYAPAGFGGSPSVALGSMMPIIVIGGLVIGGLAVMRK